MVFRSFFSYQVAEGSTTSEYSAEAIHPEVQVHHQVHLSRTRRLALDNRPRLSLGDFVRDCIVMNTKVVLEEVLVSLGARQYGLARQMIQTRGQFSEASGSSTANRSLLFFNCVTTHWVISSSLVAPSWAARFTSSIGLTSNCG